MSHDVTCTNYVDNMFSDLIFLLYFSLSKVYWEGRNERFNHNFSYQIFKCERYTFKILQNIIHVHTKNFI